MASQSTAAEIKSEMSRQQPNTWTNETVEGRVIESLIGKTRGDDMQMTSSDLKVQRRRFQYSCESMAASQHVHMSALSACGFSLHLFRSFE